MIGPVSTPQIPLSSMPGYELDYVPFTAPVSITATTEAGANTVVTGSSIAYDGSTVVLIEFYAPFGVTQPTAAAQLFVDLWDGATDLGHLALLRTPTSATGFDAPIYVARRLTPSNASHSYVIKAWTSSGTGSVNAGVGGVAATLPGFIRITRV